MQPGSLFVRLVREPGVLLDADPAPLAPRLVAVTVVGAMLFGAAVGSEHSAAQGVSAAFKMPLILLVPPMVAMPALAALAHALGMRLPPARATVAALACVARIAVFAAASAPVVWFADAITDGYRTSVFIAVTTLGLCGLVGIGPLLAAPLDDGGPGTPLRRAVVLVGTVVLFGMVSAQTGWLLRPFILHPHLPFVMFERPDSDVFTELEQRRPGAARPRRPR